MNVMESVNVRGAVLETIGQVLADGGRNSQPIEAGVELRSTLGLDSLDLAVTVVRLEQRLGVDPFRTARRNIRTVGDLIAVYEAHLAEST